MDAQLQKLKSFMSVGFGHASEYTLDKLASAHAPLVQKGLNDTHMDRLLGYMKKSLQELSIEEALVNEAIEIVASYRDNVMGRV